MKRATILISAMAAVLMVGIAPAQQANNGAGAEVAFRAALQQETVKGDLKLAIQQYQKILAVYPQDRSVAARALLHIGECYEKLGQSEAHTAYERILRDYADQSAPANEARVRLTALGGNRNASSGAVAKRLVCEDCGDSEAQFSPDGHLMAFTDWDSGDIAIRDMSTGKVTRLLAKTGTFRDSDAYGEAPRLSPDLRQVVYLWQAGGKDDHAELRVIQNEPGAKPRVLINDPEIEYFQPAGWFPDNRSVLVLSEKADKTMQLVRVSVPDGSVKVLKSLEWRVNWGSGRTQSISPDGQYIVYPALAVNPSKPRPSPPDTTDEHIYILASDGSSETEIVRAAGVNINCAWAPDGKHILFTSDRSGHVDLWSIAVEKGKAAGAESLVSPGIGELSTFGMHGGSYYYQPEEARTSYVSIAEMKPAGGKTQDARRTPENFVGQSPSWSPDGKSIAFKRPHPGGSPGDYDLVVRSLETGTERAYRTGLGTTGSNTALWFHDGNSVVTGLFRKNGTFTVCRIDLKTGDFKELPTTAAIIGPAPDDKMLFVWHRSTQQIASIDLDTGNRRPVFTPQAGTIVGSPRLSPDGRTLAFMLADPKNPNQRRIACVDADGNNYREVFATQPAYVPSENLAWTKDSRGILFELRKVTGDPFQIMRVSSEGGIPESTGIEMTDPIQSFDLSPDGSRIAFSHNKKVHDLWALDNILSALK